ETAVSAIEPARGLPGRFELIDEGQPFDVIVDFADTPDAIASVLGAVRRVTIHRPGALVHAMLGAGGTIHGRELRVPAGAAAARFADRLILTEGNLRGETLATTMALLIEGARSAGMTAIDVIAERRAAIRSALAG